MQNHVLTTALQYDAPVTYVVMNDAQLGMVRQGQGDQPIASEFVRTDWANVARGYSCVGLQVSRPEDIQPDATMGPNWPPGHGAVSASPAPQRAASIPALWGWESCHAG